MKNLIARFGKKVAFGVTTAMTVVGGSVMAFAAETADINDALVTGITAIQSQAMDAIGAVAPVAIGITGAILGVKIGIRAFRSIVG